MSSAGSKRPAEESHVPSKKPKPLINSSNDGKQRVSAASSGRFEGATQNTLPHKHDLTKNKAIEAGAASTAASVDIDAIFSGLSSAKEKAKQAEQEHKEKQASKAAASSKASDADDIAKLEQAGRKANRMRAPDSPVPLRFDPDTGMPIYSVDALKIGQGTGETALCPFDCTCCY